MDSPLFQNHSGQGPIFDRIIVLKRIVKVSGELPNRKIVGLAPVARLSGAA
jgi:hypothetical protein